MQIVIDIPEEMYQEIKEIFKVISGSRRSERFDYILFDAVNAGTPLPKGHGRLIDADAFAEKIEKIIRDKAYYSLKTDMISVGEVLHAVVEELNGTTLCGFDNAPTIIEADTESEDKKC